MTGLVVDASVTAAWLFEDETTAFSERMLDRCGVETAWVPALWVLETANVLLSAQRRGRVTGEQRKRLVEAALSLPLMIDRDPVSMATLDSLADRFGLSAYDAACLELAIRRSLPLAIRDRKLVQAAKGARHPVETGP